MSSIKTGLAVVGLAAIIVAAGFAVFTLTSSNETDSDGASYDQIRADLQTYADILNEGGTLYVNAPVSSSYTSSLEPSHYRIYPTAGTVEVSGMNLVFDVVVSSTSHNHYAIAYHSITGVTQTVSDASTSS